MTRINALRSPGTVLKEDFLEPLGLSEIALAREIGLPLFTLGRVVRDEAPVTPDLARVLGRRFDVDPQWWLDMQARWDHEASGDDVLGDLGGIIPVRAS
jgi:addiction module HigA family antidote